MDGSPSLLFLVLVFLVTEVSAAGSCQYELTKDLNCELVRDPNGTYCQTCKLLPTTSICIAGCDPGQACDTIGPEIEVRTPVKANNCSKPEEWWKKCEYVSTYISLECETCADNHYGHLCLPCPNCGGSGRCNDGITGDGGCKCDDNFVGPLCQYSRTKNCNDHGDPSPVTGACTCDAGWSQEFACSTCLPNHFLPACIYCKNDTTCNGHGTCIESGANAGECLCDKRYTGATCASCARDYSLNYPTCTYCVASDTCNGRGTCDSQYGVCVCGGNFTGPSCAGCLPGYFGPNCDVCPGFDPVSYKACHGRGTCADGAAGDGKCKCHGDYRGVECNDPVLRTLEPAKGAAAGGYPITIDGLLFGNNGTVYMGYKQLTVVSYSEISIVVTVAAGLGSPKVKVVRSDGSESNSLDFEFDLPFLSRVEVCPCNGQPITTVIDYDPVVSIPTQGAEVMLYGINLGNAAAGSVVLLDGLAVQVTNWSATLVRAVLPAGLGFYHTIKIHPQGANVTNTLLIAYGPPLIIQAEAKAAPTQGGTSLTLTGSNFGKDAVLEVRVGGRRCENITARNHTTVICSLPPGRGADKLVELRLDVLRNGSINWSAPVVEDLRPDREGNGRAARAFISFSYDPSRITALSGCPGDSGGNTTSLCNPFGGNPLTVSGFNFGASVAEGTSELRVTVAGLPCFNVTMLQPHRRIQCLLPRTSGRNVDVVVFLWPSQNGQLDSKPWLSYDTPFLDSNTLELAVPAASPNADGLDSPSFGTTSMGLTGDNGVYSAVVGTSVLGGDELIMRGYFLSISNQSSSRVTYGPSGQTGEYSCAVTEANSTFLRCRTSSGVGKNLVFRLNVSGVLGEVGSDTFSYPPPILIPHTLRTPGESIRPQVIATGQFISELSNQGENMELDGRHLPADTALITAAIGPPGDPTRFLCDVLFVNYTRLECRVAPGDGVGNAFTIRVGFSQHPETLQSGFSNDTYSYPEAPSIINTSGCPTIDGDGTSDCPTAGNVKITIFGKGFTSSGAQVRVGRTICTGVEHDPYIPNEKLTCDLPPGAGALQAITVNKKQRYSQARPLISYAKPRLFSVEGCENPPDIQALLDAAASTGTNLELNINSTENCPRDGGTVITIRGKNLGGSGATVLVGGQGCTNVQHDINRTDPHSIIMCTLLPGSSRALTILVIQKGGSISFDDLRLSYTPCQPGKREQLENVTCIQCEKGKFTEQAGATVCEECTPGRFSKAGASVCSRCAAGYFAKDSAQDTCAECEAGTYAPNLGSQGCVSCPAGRYTAIKGQSSCPPCSLGKVQQFSGRTKCDLCTPGYYMGQAGQLICEACIAGYFNTANESFSCQQCPAGSSTLGLQGRTSCTECGNGTRATTPGSAICSVCQKGRYSNERFPTQCKACLVGEFSEISGSSECKVCPPGFITTSSAATQCTPCAVGSAVAAPGQSRCPLCPAGKHQDRQGQVECLDCAQGRSNPTDGQAQCTPCALGSATNNTMQSYCGLCEKGTHAASTGLSVCQPCEPGFFSLTDGASQCDACSVGFYASEVGSKSCTVCAPGSVAATQSLSACDKCKPGQYVSNQPAVQCRTCLPGFFTANFSSISPEACPPGYAQPASGGSTCDLCPSGSFATSGSPACFLCSGGEYQPAAGKSSCLSCPAGKFSGEIQGVGMTSCTNCSAGSYNPSENRKQCDLCAKGFFTKDPGMSRCEACNPGYKAGALGQSKCDSCRAGRFQASAGQEDCEECKTGQYLQFDNGTSCLQCKEGHFAPKPESPDCDPCPPGKKMGSVGASTCEQCETGSFAAKNSSEKCDACSAGFYLDVEGSFNPCWPCDPGLYAAGPGRTVCSQCDRGKYAMVQNSSSCMACEAGKYVDANGATACYECLAGTFSLQGMRTCTECPAGYNSSGGASSCSKCAAGRFNARTGSPTCEECEKGQTSDPTNTACTPCPPNTCAPEKGWPECLLCGENSESNKELTACLCAPTFYGVKEFPNSTTETKCKPCPPGFDCAEKGKTRDKLELMPGWWAEKDSLVAYRCRNPFDCLGGIPGEARYNLNGTVQSSLVICKDHHSGPLCSLCEKGYTKTSGGACIICGADVATQKRSTVFAGFMLCLALVCIFFFMLKMDTEKYTLLKKELEESYDQEKKEETMTHVIVGRRGDTFWFADETDPDRPLSIGDPSPVPSSQALMADNTAFRSDASTGTVELAAAGSSSEEAEVEPLPDLGASEDSKETLQPRKSKDLEEIAAKVHSLQSWRDLQQHKYFKDSTQSKLKILVTFFQIMTSLVFFLDYPWPTPYSGVIAWFGFVNFSPIELTRSDCLVDMDYLSQWIMIVAFPIVVLLALAVFYLIPWPLCTACLFRRSMRTARIVTRLNRYTFIKLTLFWFFLIYPRMAASTFGIWQCVEVNGVEYLIHDFRVECRTERWWRFATVDIAFIALYPVGIPLISWFLLKNMNATKTFDSYDKRYTLGFLYEAFAPDVWWFEIADIFHKLIMTSCLAFFPRQYQVQIGMLVVTLYAIIIIIRVPYYRWSIQMLHLLAQTELLLFLMSAFTFLLSDRPLDPGKHLFISITMLFVSAVFVTFFIYTMVKFFLIKGRAILAKRGYVRAAKIKKIGMSTRELLRNEDHQTGVETVRRAYDFSKAFSANQADHRQEEIRLVQDQNEEVPH